MAKVRNRGAWRKPDNDANALLPVLADFKERNVMPESLDLLVVRIDQARDVSLEMRPAPLKPRSIEDHHCSIAVQDPLRMLPMSAMSEFRKRLAKIPKTANIGATATHSHAFALCSLVGDSST